MNCSFKSVPFYCAVLLPMCMFVHLYDIFVMCDINKALMQPILAMLGLSTLAMAIRPTTIRRITIMLGALGPESKKYARV